MERRGSTQRNSEVGLALALGARSASAMRIDPALHPQGFVAKPTRVAVGSVYFPHGARHHRYSGTLRYIQGEGPRSRSDERKAVRRSARSEQRAAVPPGRRLLLRGCDRLSQLRRAAGSRGGAKTLLGSHGCAAGTGRRFDELEPRADARHDRVLAAQGYVRQRETVGCPRRDRLRVPGAWLRQALQDL